MTSLAGRHAVVTGANRGIGAAIATSLVASGARVTLLVRNRDAGIAAAAPFGDAATVVTADVTREADVVAACHAAREQFGPVHILVNNAGSAESAPILRSDRALFERMMAVHVYGAVSCTRELLPDMFEAGFGRIINIASTAGVAGAPYIAAYAAAKHAMVGFTRSVAKEIFGRGVTVNAICPGYTVTDIVTSTVASIAERAGKSHAEARAVLLGSNPGARFVTPPEVAQAVCWLCDDQSGATTGQTIIIDGGQLT